MKKIISIISAFILLNLTASVAQNLKFGHINSTQLLSFMPETKAADSSINKFGTSLQNQLKTMGAELDSKVNEYKNSEASMAEPIKIAKQKEITDLQDRIQEFQQSAQESIQKKKEELYSPIIKKAEGAINAIAKEKSYSYIFDSSLGVLLFANDGDDIMSQVKAKLGLK